MPRQCVSTRPHKPPMERAAISSSQMPCALTRTSACTGPVTSPAARHARATVRWMPSCTLSRQPGRRDVEGFLEVRPVQRIGLVEQGQRRELAPLQAAFQRVLPSGNEVLDDQSQLLGVAVGARLDGAHPVHRAHQRGGIVGADHAAASRQAPRLHDHWKPQVGDESPGVLAAR